MLTQLNTDLYEYGTNTTIPYLAGVTADYGLASGPTIGSASASISANGTFYDKAHPWTKAYTPAAITPTDLKGKELQVYLTQYLLNTMFDAGFTTGNTLDITYLLEKYLGLAVTTDNLSVVIPQMLTKYGSGKNCTIKGKFITAPSSVGVATTGYKIDASLQVTIAVGEDTALFASLPHTMLNGLQTLKAATLHGKFDTYQLGTIDASDFQTTLGITAAALQKEVQDLLNTTFEALNAALAAGVPLPEIFGLDFSKANLDWNDGYINLGGSVSADFWVFVANSLSAVKEEL